MKKYFVIMNKGDEFEEEFERVEDAIIEAEYSFAHLTENEKKGYSGFYILETENLDIEEDDYMDGDIIRDLLMEWRLLKDLERYGIFETQEGKTKDCCDVLVGTRHGLKDFWLKGLPFFDESGREVGYDEALELYGEDGLSQEIWDDLDYRDNILYWAKTEGFDQIIEEAKKQPLWY